jgi:hypothetical protein
MWAPGSPKKSKVPERRLKVTTPSRIDPSQQPFEKPQHSPEWDKLFAHYQRPVKHELPTWLAHETGPQQDKSNDPGEAVRRQYGSK